MLMRLTSLSLLSIFAIVCRYARTQTIDDHQAATLLNSFEIHHEGNQLPLRSPQQSSNLTVCLDFDYPYDGAIIGPSLQVRMKFLFSDPQDERYFDAIKGNYDVCLQLDDLEPGCCSMANFQTPHLSGLSFGDHTLQAWINYKGRQSDSFVKLIRFRVINTAFVSEKVTKNWFAYAPKCENSSVLKNIPHVSRDLIEQENAVWFGEVQRRLERTYTAVAPAEPQFWNRFDVFMPAVPVCPSMRRVGGTGDGGKYICGLNEIPVDADRPCIIYSIGSDNNWGFEEDIYNSTSCDVFTFDCTVEGLVPPQIRDRVSFHHICLGQGGQREGEKYMSLKEIMTMFGHAYVTLLKADIEGYEYTMFEQLLNEDSNQLPEQISFELHYYTDEPGLEWRSRNITTGEIVLLATRLYIAGFRVISREDNINCYHCSEFTMLRFLCP